MILKAFLWFLLVPSCFYSAEITLKQISDANLKNSAHSLSLHLNEVKPFNNNANFIFGVGLHQNYKGHFAADVKAGLNVSLANTQLTFYPQWSVSNYGHPKFSLSIANQMASTIEVSHSSLHFRYTFGLPLSKDFVIGERTLKYYNFSQAEIGYTFSPKFKTAFTGTYYHGLDKWAFNLQISREINKKITAHFSPGLGPNSQKKAEIAISYHFTPVSRKGEKLINKLPFHFQKGKLQTSKEKDQYPDVSVIDLVPSQESKQENPSDSSNILVPEAKGSSWWDIFGWFDD